MERNENSKKGYKASQEEIVTKSIKNNNWYGQAVMKKSKRTLKKMRTGGHFKLINKKK